MVLAPGCILVLYCIQPLTIVAIPIGLVGLFTLSFSVTEVSYSLLTYPLVFTSLISFANSALLALYTPSNKEAVSVMIPISANKSTNFCKYSLFTNAIDSLRLTTASLDVSLDCFCIFSPLPANFSISEFLRSINLCLTLFTNSLLILSLSPSPLNNPICFCISTHAFSTPLCPDTSLIGTLTYLILSS